MTDPVQLRTLGNQQLQQKELTAALRTYTAAIDLILSQCNDEIDAGLHLCYSNRALCNLRLENLGAATTDADHAIKIQPNFHKAYYRRGEAQFALGHYKKARQDFRRVYNDTYDKDAKTRIKACDTLIKQALFAAAIKLEHKLASSTIDFETISVRDDYKGPRYMPKASRAGFNPEPNASNGPQFMKELFMFLRASHDNRLHHRYVLLMLLDVLDLLTTLPNIVDVPLDHSEGISICGDVHGQFYDLMNIFDMNGEPCETNPYLFNGDIVDRGSFSCECILSLFAAKLAFPDHVHLARGNHETQSMNKIYGFYGEVKSKYNTKVYEVFCETFCRLPLAHKIDNQILVLHGGLFNDDNVTLETIQAIDRNVEPSDHGVLCELLWSDPQTDLGRKFSKRGVGCEFGQDVTERFLKANNLKLIVRSHELQDAGYSLHHSNQLVTVFSAPNYCDQFNNLGAIMKVKPGPVSLSGDDQTITFKQFSAVKHPFVRAMEYADPMLRF